MIPLREALINKSNITNAKTSPREALDPTNPKNWRIGDVIFITFNYNACIPVFYVINKLVGKVTFEIQEVGKTLVSGFYNSAAGYEVEPNLSKKEGEPKRVRISNGCVKIDKQIARLWTGTPVHGYSD